MPASDPRRIPAGSEPPDDWAPPHGCMVLLGALSLLLVLCLIAGVLLIRLG